MSRTWAMGAIKIVANGAECFGWVGTKNEAIELQKGYLDVIGALPLISQIPERPNAHSYAVRAAGYLMA